MGDGQVAGRGWVMARSLRSEIATKLGVLEGDSVIRLVRLRLGNDQPMVFTVNSIRRDALPGPLKYRDWGASLNKMFETHGDSIESSPLARITAGHLPGDFAERLDLSALGPWLIVEEVFITREGLRVVHALDYHRSSEIGFNVARRG